MDALTSFDFLVNNIPLWKEQVAKLTEHTTQKHEEFKAEYIRLVSQAKPQRLKSPSMCSIHTNDDPDHETGEIQRESTPQPPNLVDISPFEAGNRYIYAQATKKRKPGTSFRSGASGPIKFRSKQMVVIYYDSYVQEHLDAMVKSIGGSRNNLRKGKMAYTLSSGLQLPSLGRKYDLPISMTGLDGIKLSSAGRNPPKAATSNPLSSTLNDPLPTGEAAFKQADKDLETCQNLCETAAHQFLRDGDCKLELDTVKHNFDKVLTLATAMLESLKADKQREEASTEQASMNGSSTAESDATLVEKPSREILNFSHKIMPSPRSDINVRRPSVPTSHSAPPMMNEIEVDDNSDQSSIEIDMSKYRINNRAGNRPGLRP